MLKNNQKGTFLVIQWLRIYLPMRGHGLDPWSERTPHGQGATKPVYHNY